MPALLRSSALTHVLGVLIVTASPAWGAEILPPGHRPVPLGVHVLTGGKVVVKPGEVIESGTIVIRDGFIAAVGAKVEVPANARVWPMTGLTIYPGLIDCYLTMDSSNAPVSTTRTEPIAQDRALTSGSLNYFGVPGEEIDPGARGPGYQLEAVRAQNRVAESYTPNVRALEALHELGFTSANIVHGGGLFRGSSAFVNLSPSNPNDALVRADVFQSIAFAIDGAREGPYPRSLMGAIAAVRQVLYDADFYARDHEHYTRQPQGRKRPGHDPALEALHATIVTNGSRAMAVFEPGSVLMVDRAARIGRELGLRFCMVASGQEWRRPDLVKAAATPLIVPVNFPELPKLPEVDDWDQVTLEQLRAWDWAPSNPALLRQNGLDIALTTHGLGDKKNFRKKLQLAVDRGLSEADALAALTTVPAQLCGLEKVLGTIEPGKIANLTVVEGESYFQPDTRVREVWIDGRMYPTRPVIKTNEIGKASAPTNSVDKAATNQVNPDTLKTDPKSRRIRGERIARAPLDGKGPLATPPAVLVRGATLWTCGGQGRLEAADLLIVGGKIQAIGPDLKAPAQFGDAAVVIDGAGRHVTPGLIDAHNHSMILGAVNEGTLPCSAMVRVADVVNSETAHIYRQLAGGLTTANLLHGSANPIGGQNCIIKLRDGASPEELKLADAPPGIKFALGENVKQSNWGDRNTTRFPQSRMGVGTFLANRFVAAQQYLKEREEADRPLRRDLELEALGEILKGRRWIHCHSYRQDEILAFLRLMEGFGVKVGTLQHVLEGYKVADEIAAHGAGASCFADWWGYKFEVFDAIPYAGSLMHQRGVLVSFNSDSSDHARRLNLEAAKAVKYGATTEEEALKFVTINPARQLRIDGRVGSLETGKDADFVLWSKSPLDSSAVCLQTWIDGRKYFDREHEPQRALALQKEREELIAKAQRILRNPGRAQTGDELAEAKFFEVTLEHRYDATDRHCLDEER